MAEVDWKTQEVLQLVFFSMEVYITNLVINLLFVSFISKLVHHIFVWMCVCVCVCVFLGVIFGVYNYSLPQKS